MNYIIVAVLIIIIIICIILNPITENFNEYYVDNTYQDNLDNYDIYLIYLYNANLSSKLNMFNPNIWRNNEQQLRNNLETTYKKKIKVNHFNIQSQLNLIVNRENPVLWSLISPDCMPDKDKEDEQNINTSITNKSFDENGFLIANNNYITGPIQSKILLCMIPLNSNCKYTKIPVKWNIPLKTILGNEKSITNNNFINLISKLIINRIPLQIPYEDLITKQINNPDPELIIYNNHTYIDRAIIRGIELWTKSINPDKVCPPEKICPPEKVNDNINNYDIHLIYIYNSVPSNSFNFYANTWLPKKQEIINQLKQTYPNIIINDYRMTIDTKELTKNPLLWSMTNMYARQGNPTTIFSQSRLGNGFQFDENGNFIQSSYQQTAMNPQLVLIIIPKNKNANYSKLPIKWQIPDGNFVKGGPVLTQNNIVNELDNYVKTRIPIELINYNVPIQNLKNIVSDPNIWIFNENSYKDPIVEKAIELMNNY